MVQLASPRRTSPDVGDTAYTDAVPVEPVSVEALSIASSVAGGSPPTGPAPSSGPPSLIGQTLGGRYLVTSLIGAGGMGAVYRAEHTQLQKPVALKVLNADMAAHREAAQRFEREALVSARIVHPNVVSATDSGRLADGSLYLVLEFVSGRSLRQLIDAEGRLPPARALAIAGQIAEALAAAHAAEIVHRDLKPGNVMLLERDGNSEFVKVLDFGLARVLGQPSTAEPLTRSGAIFGTPEYMAPEQARGEAVDHRADLYALGIILYELLSGKPPFQAQELVAVLIKHLQEPPPPLPADIPAPLAAYVMSLLDKQPAQRPQDALSVVKALRRLAPHSPVHTLPPSRSTAPPRDLVVPLVPSLVSQVAGGARWCHERLLLPLLRRSRDPALLRRLRNAALLGGSPVRRLAVALAVLMPLAALVALLLWPSGSNPELEQRARQGEPQALSELAALAAAKRSAAASLALAVGSLNGGQSEAGLKALGEALTADPELADNAELSWGVRRAVDDAATREQALEFAATRLGARGIDLLFDVWLSKTAKAPTIKAARKWIDKDTVRAQASPAVKMALALRETKGCSALRDLLPKAKSDGDERSLGALKRLQSKSGCGFLSLEDCYSCMRSDASLEQAISAVTARPAPSFEAPATATAPNSGK
jgi:serine/threonine-protein kinase